MYQHFYSLYFIAYHKLSKLSSQGLCVDHLLRDFAGVALLSKPNITIRIDLLLASPPFHPIYRIPLLASEGLARPSHIGTRHIEEIDVHSILFQAKRLQQICNSRLKNDDK